MLKKKDQKKIDKIKKMIEEKLSNRVFLWYKNTNGDFLHYPILLSLGGTLNKTILPGYVLKYYKEHKKQGSPTVYSYFIMNEDGAFTSPLGHNVKYSTFEEEGVYNLGYSLRDGKESKLNLGTGDKNKGHILVSGASGTGKSVFIGNLLKQFLEEGANVVMVEKGDSGPSYDYLPLYDQYKDQVILYTTDEEITKSQESILNFLLFLLVARNIQNQREGKTLMILDEFQSLTESVRNMGLENTYKHYLNLLITKARGSNINLLFGTQNMSKTQVPREIAGNIRKKYLGQVENTKTLNDLDKNAVPKSPSAMNYLFKEYDKDGKRIRAPLIDEFTYSDEEIEEILKNVGDYYSTDALLNKIKILIDEYDLESDILNNSDYFYNMFFGGQSQIIKQLKNSSGYFLVLYFLYKITVVFKEKDDDLNIGDFNGFNIDVVRVEYLEGLDEVFESLFFEPCFNKGSDVSKIFNAIQDKGKEYDREFKREEREGIELEDKLKDFKYDIIKIVRGKIRKKYVQTFLDIDNGSNNKEKDLDEEKKEKNKIKLEDIEREQKEKSEGTPNTIPDETDLDLIKEFVPD